MEIVNVSPYSIPPAREYMYLKSCTVMILLSDLSTSLYRYGGITGQCILQRWPDWSL